MATTAAEHFAGGGVLFEPHGIALIHGIFVVNINKGVVALSPDVSVISL